MVWLTAWRAPENTFQLGSVPKHKDSVGAFGMQFYSAYQRTLEMGVGSLSAEVYSDARSTWMFSEEFEGGYGPSSKVA